MNHAEASFLKPLRAVRMRAGHEFKRNVFLASAAGHLLALTAWNEKLVDKALSKIAELADRQTPIAP